MTHLPLNTLKAVKDNGWFIYEKYCKKCPTSAFPGMEKLCICTQGPRCKFNLHFDADAHAQMQIKFNLKFTNKYTVVRIHMATHQFSQSSDQTYSQNSYP